MYPQNEPRFSEQITNGNNRKVSNVLDKLLLMSIIVNLLLFTFIVINNGMKSNRLITPTELSTKLNKLDSLQQVYITTIEELNENK